MKKIAFGKKKKLSERIKEFLDAQDKKEAQLREFNKEFIESARRAANRVYPS